MSKIAGATVVGQGIRQRPHDQSGLSLINHYPVFVVKRHGREFALVMALGAPQLSKMDTFSSFVQKFGDGSWTIRRAFFVWTLRHPTFGRIDRAHKKSPASIERARG